MRSIIELCDGFAVHEFAPGAVLFAEGDAAGTLYVLIGGCVEIVKGDDPVHTVTEAGAIFGEIAALLDIPSLVTVRATTACRVHVIEGGAAFLEAHPALAFCVLKLFAQRLYGLTNYVGDVRRQFAHHDSHFAMVHSVVETLVHHAERSFTPGSDRDPGV